MLQGLRQKAQRFFMTIEFLQGQPQVGQSLYMRGLALQDRLVQRHRQLQPMRAGGQRGLEVERRHFMRRMQTRHGQQGIGLRLGLVPFGLVIEGHSGFIQGLRLGCSRGRTNSLRHRLPQHFGEDARGLCSSTSGRWFFHGVTRPDARRDVLGERILVLKDRPGGPR